MQSVELPKFFGTQLVRRLIEVNSKIANRANVAANGLGTEVAPLKFVQLRYCSSVQNDFLFCYEARFARERPHGMRGRRTIGAERRINKQRRTNTAGSLNSAVVSAKAGHSFHTSPSVMNYVYLLQIESHPTQRYTGLNSDLNSSAVQ